MKVHLLHWPFSYKHCEHVATVLLRGPLLVHVDNTFTKVFVCDGVVECGRIFAHVRILCFVQHDLAAAMRGLESIAQFHVVVHLEAVVQLQGVVVCAGARRQVHGSPRSRAVRFRDHLQHFAGRLVWEERREGPHYAHLKTKWLT